MLVAGRHIISAGRKFLLQKNTPPYLVCFIGSSTPSKQYGKENWIQFISLCKKQWNYEIVLSGGTNDIPLAKAIAEAVSVTDITGQKTIPALINVFGKCRFL